MIIIKYVKASNKSLVGKARFLEVFMSDENKLVKKLKLSESSLKKESEQTKKTIQKLVNEIISLDHIMSIDKESNDKRELGYINKTSNLFSSKTTFIIKRSQSHRRKLL